MTKMGNSGENRTSLAEGIIEQAAVFAPCITNNFFFKQANIHLLEIVMSSLLSASLLQVKMRTSTNMSLQKQSFVA